ncbi:hypothetical protein D3C71_2160700 [compost metagenome]
MHMGNEHSAQIMQRQRGAQQLMLGGLAAIDQVPALAGRFDQGGAADIPGPGRHPGRGAEKLQVHG